MIEVLPEPGAPYKRYPRRKGMPKCIGQMPQNRKRIKRRTTVGIPSFTFHKVTGVIEKQLLDTFIQHNGRQRTLGSRSYVTPIITIPDTDDISG